MDIGKPGFNMLKNEFDIFYIGGIRLNIPISGFYTQKNDLALLEISHKISKSKEKTSCLTKILLKSNKEMTLKKFKI